MPFDRGFVSRASAWRLGLWCACAAWLVGAARAAAPDEGPDARAQIQRYLAELRRNPRDVELRETIIKLAVSMRPPPSVPDEVDELEGRAEAAMKDAKSPSDYLAAAQAYDEALSRAPWLAADYLALADAQEKSGKLREAAASLRLYLVAAPGAADAKAVRRRIGALVYRAERSVTPAGSAVNAPPEPAPGTPRAFPNAAQRFKTSAPKRYDATYECGRLTPSEALRRRQRLDCDQADLDAGRWHEFEMLATHQFRYPDDGTIRLDSVRRFGSAPELLGRPQGPTLRDIRWFRCDDRGACDEPVWVRVAEDLSTLTFSPDRPAADSGVAPSARFHYTQYRYRVK